jgi:hypothetical protein
MTAQADGSVVMLHQRGVVDTITPTPGGYGGTNPCNAIVHPAITVVGADGTMKTGPALAGLVMAVDMALSPDGAKVAVISAGNATNQPVMSTSTMTGPQLTRVFVTDLSAVVNDTIGCRPDGTSGPCLPPNTSLAATEGQPQLNGCPANPQVVGQPIAVAYAGDGSVVVQSREPAMLAMPDGNNISLSTESRNDTGHLVFHANAGGFIACASCHVEGDDDGRVWNFDCNTIGGARRTQTLHAGIRGTEPLHWAGDEATMDQLMADVFVTRMSGPKLVTDQLNALVSWIDAQPRRTRSLPTDTAAIERGRTLFNDSKAACATCHSGARMSNNTTVDVGTGRAFQVPSLIGIGTRGPFMHNGCALTLRDRFRPECGGGDLHGVTSNLSDAQISDLVAYLETL